METTYTDKMKDVMQSVYEMADKLDAKGIGHNIPFVIVNDKMFCLMRELKGA